MDKRIRRNELCGIGLPRCDFVFSSTRSCFIAYGFEESQLEMTILRNILEKKGIHPVEAGGSLAPAQNAFCAKICSKIITSQFCIVLLNNEEKDNQEVPNANVNMEYGLMLGFNKYVIPFQRASQKLPFNVAGLDTIKYTNKNFEQKATKAIEQAIEETRQEVTSLFELDQILQAFLIARKALVTPINSEVEKIFYQLASPLGFNLLNDFSGLNYMFFGNFTMFRPEIVIWRIQMLREILNERRSSIGTRLDAGVVTEGQAVLFENLLDRLEIWCIVTGDKDKRSVNGALHNVRDYDIRIFTVEDVQRELEKLENKEK